MIFITLGSQKFQFNRLLEEVDKLIEQGIITEEVFAQIGYSDYKPKNYKYNKFLDRDEFAEIIKKCDKVITHGGTGAIINAVKNNKKVIAIPRLAKYGEHVDDHQLQIVKKFKEMGVISICNDTKYLKKIYDEIESKIGKIYISNTEAIIESIDRFLRNF